MVIPRGPDPLALKSCGVNISTNFMAKLSGKNKTMISPYQPYLPHVFEAVNYFEIFRFDEDRVQSYYQYKLQVAWPEKTKFELTYNTTLVANKYTFEVIINKYRFAGQGASFREAEHIAYRRYSSRVATLCQQDHSKRDNFQLNTDRYAPSYNLYECKTCKLLNDDIKPIYQCCICARKVEFGYTLDKDNDVWCKACVQDIPENLKRVNEAGIVKPYDGINIDKWLLWTYQKIDKLKVGG